MRRKDAVATVLLVVVLVSTVTVLYLFTVESEERRLGSYESNLIIDTDKETTQWNVTVSRVDSAVQEEMGVGKDTLSLRHSGDVIVEVNIRPSETGNGNVTVLMTDEDVILTSDTLSGDRNTVVIECQSQNTERRDGYSCRSQTASR